MARIFPEEGTLKIGSPVLARGVWRIPYRMEDFGSSVYVLNTEDAHSIEREIRRRLRNRRRLLGISPYGES